MPAFSIIIPCFNAAATLRQTLASVFAQCVTDFEVICVDDGSMDETLDLLQEMARAEPRLRVVSRDNGGPSRARNIGADLARGSWIAFLDADDLWLPGKLASVADAVAANPEADAVYGQIAFFRNDAGTDTVFSSPRPGSAKLSDLTGENPVGTLSNLTVRRDAFLAAGGFDETLSYSEDLEFLIRFHLSGNVIWGTDDLHVRYRTSDGGLSADLYRMHEGWRRAVRSAGTEMSNRELARAEAIHFRYLARRALRVGAPGATAFAFAIRGLCRSPAAFLGDRHRGPATLAGCLAAPLLPSAIRRRTFA